MEMDFVLFHVVNIKILNLFLKTYFVIFDNRWLD